MKKSFMEALYYGEIRPFEYETKHSPEYDAAEADIEEAKTYLKGRLSPEDAEHLDDLEDLYNHFSTFENVDCFAHGLRFGILLMMDVMTAE